MLNTLLDINQLEAGIVRPKSSFFRSRACSTAQDRVHLSRGHQRSRLARGSEHPHRAQRSASARADDAQSVVECGEVHHRGQAPARLPTPRRQGADRGLGHRPRHPRVQLPAIFEEFHQVDNPARERSQGLGLGLAIVQRLADLLGHTIDVRSRLGAGSVFAVEVPLGRREAVDVPMSQVEETQASTPARGTILIVEDDPAVREMLQLLFGDEGHRTIVAADGQGRWSGQREAGRARPHHRRLQSAQGPQWARDDRQAQKQLRVKSPPSS